MPRKLPTNPNSITNSHFTPIKNWLQGVEFTEQRLWSIRNNQLVTRYNNEFLTLKQFYERFPVSNPVSFRLKAENSDGTKKYLL